MKNKIIFICALLVPFSLCAKIYEYKDAQGETHFSQEPPADGNAVVVKPKFGSSQQTKTSTTQQQSDKKANVDNTQNAQKNQEETKEPLDPQTIEALKVNCERSKNYLQEIESKPRIRLQDAAGKVTFLTDEQRDQEIVKTKAAVKKFCNPQ